MKFKLIIILIFFSHNVIIFATVQHPDYIIYDGIRYSLALYDSIHLSIPPMEAYFNEFPQRRPGFTATNLYRCYVATFEIIDNELWAIKIETYGVNNLMADVTNECLDGRDRIKVNWFSGLIIINNYAQNIAKIIEIENGIYTFGQVKIL